MSPISIAPPPNAGPIVRQAFAAKTEHLKVQSDAITEAHADRYVQGGMPTVAQSAAKQGAADTLDTLDELHELCLQKNLSGVQRFFAAAPNKATRRADAQVDEAITALTNARTLTLLAKPELDTDNTGTLYEMVEGVITAGKQATAAAAGDCLAAASPAKIRELDTAVTKLKEQALDVLVHGGVSARLEQITNDLASVPFAGMGPTVMRQSLHGFQIATSQLLEICGD